MKILSQNDCIHNGLYIMIYADFTQRNSYNSMYKSQGNIPSMHYQTIKAQFCHHHWSEEFPLLSTSI